MTTPDYRKMADGIFDKLMPRRNDIHPFQEGWAEGFSCSMEDLTEEIESRLRTTASRHEQIGWEKAVEACARVCETTDIDRERCHKLHLTLQSYEAGKLCCSIAIRKLMNLEYPEVKIQPVKPWSGNK